jgi:phosphoglycerate dehydrogenase-like enzyme
MNKSALFLLDEEHWDNVYGQEERERCEAWFSGPLCFQGASFILQDPSALAKADVIFSGWGMPRCDEAFLAKAPHLKAIFHAAGSVRGFVTDALWARGIIVSSSNNALAVAVAEFTLAQVLLSLKSTWRQASDMRMLRRPLRHVSPGIYGSTVGLVSVGAVARSLISLMRPFNLKILAYDPYLSEEAGRLLGVDLVSLEKLFELSHVISLHAPLLPETEGIIRGHHLNRMQQGATLINTARGAVVNESEMIEVLRRRGDLSALLDVTAVEPLPAESPLYDLPNVILTPHIAGALHRECRRLGAMAVDEFERYVQGKPLLGQVHQSMMATSA